MGRIAGAGIGAGLIFSSLLMSISRNPSLKNDLLGVSLIGFALTEATAIFCLLIAFLILFAL